MMDVLLSQIYLAASVAGTLTWGYFFAFHMLNIVTTNELLKGVIRAVTVNGEDLSVNAADCVYSLCIHVGKSLLWVAILGVIVIYIYALVAFAFLRPSFDPANQLYCGTLFECTITVLRMGLTGIIDELLVLQELENTFEHFGLLAIYQISFFIFITTIGLNIIFGIIVDTFSELRDCKVLIR
jgi:inositol 1,4,5-triphosphate receptor type 1